MRLRHAEISVSIVSMPSMYRKSSKHAWVVPSRQQGMTDLDVEGGLQ